MPKTIDNDLNGTDYTFGFDTAVAVATDAVDRCHSTAESHNRIIVVETMGRHAGWIALFTGIAGGADYILIPEQPVDYDDVAAAVERRRTRGKNFSVIVASEGAELPGIADEGEIDEFGHVRVENRAVGETVAQEVEKRTGMQTRATVLGYIQRGGSPTPRDRILGLRFGLKAADLVRESNWGQMAALHGDEVALGAADRGDRGAEARLARVVRDGKDVLRLTAARIAPTRGRSSVGRASASQAEGRGFEPHRPLPPYNRQATLGADGPSTAGLIRASSTRRLCRSASGSPWRPEGLEDESVRDVVRRRLRSGRGPAQATLSAFPGVTFKAGTCSTKPDGSVDLRSNPDIPTPAGGGAGVGSAHALGRARARDFDATGPGVSRVFRSCCHLRTGLPLGPPIGPVAAARPGRDSDPMSDGRGSRSASARTIVAALLLRSS